MTSHSVVACFGIALRIVWKKPFLGDFAKPAATTMPARLLQWNESTPTKRIYLKIRRWDFY